MVSWILLIIILVVLIVVLTALFSTAFGRGESTEQLPATATLNAENLAAIDECNLRDVSFDVVTRGYNQAQVDAVVEYLYAQKEAATKQADELRKQVAQLEARLRESAAAANEQPGE